MKILVLGADGFLGSHLTRALLAQGHQIRAFDRFRDNQCNNLESIKEHLEVFSGDFMNQNDIIEATNDQDWVFHFISTTNPSSSSKDPIFDISTNVNGTISLLNACVQNNVKKVIFASSGGTIYGNQNKDKFSENDLTLPISPYGISKLAIERFFDYYKVAFNLDYCIFRYSNPYGPNQNKVGSQGVIPIFLNKLKNKESITVFGSGEIIRDYIYIDDIIEMTLDLLKIAQPKYSVYNIGSSIGTSLNQVIDVIEKVTNEKFIIERKPQRAFDVKSVVLDNSRIFEEIKLKSLINLEKGIEKLWQSMNN